MRDGIGCWISNGGVREHFCVEPGAGIAEIVDDRPLCSHRRDVHDFFRIESRAVLHGVHEHFTKRSQQIFAHLLLHIRAKRGHETGQPIRRDEVARDAKRNPFCPGGQHFNAVTPIPRFRGRTNQVGNLAAIERRDEAREHAGAQRRDHVRRRDRWREKDCLQPWPKPARFFEQRQILIHMCAAARHQHVVRALAQSAQRIHRTARPVDFVVSRQRVR
jgi:hypothetical protein